MNDIAITNELEVKIQINLNGNKIWLTNDEMRHITYFIKQLISRRVEKDVIISSELSERIDRTKIGQGNRSALGQMVTEDSVFAPINAKEIGDTVRAKYVVDDGENMTVVDGVKKSRISNAPITLSDGKVVNI